MVNQGVRQVPYRLPELLANPKRFVFLPEGEKDVDNLAVINLLATCNSGGAGKWTAEHAQYLRGRRVFVLPDNDEAGRKHAQQVATHCKASRHRYGSSSCPACRPRATCRIGWKLVARGGDWLAGRSLAGVDAGRNAYIGTDLDLLGRCRTSFDFVAVARANPTWAYFFAGWSSGGRQEFSHYRYGGACDTGTPWPDGALCPMGSVILISAEDDPGDTIRPRLDAHHADVRRVHQLSAVRRVDDDGHHDAWLRWPTWTPSRRC